MKPKPCPYCGGRVIDAKFTLHEMPFPDPYCGQCGRNIPRKSQPLKKAGVESPSDD